MRNCVKLRWIKLSNGELFEITLFVVRMKRSACNPIEILPLTSKLIYIKKDYCKCMLSGVKDILKWHLLKLKRGPSMSADLSWFQFVLSMCSDDLYGKRTVKLSEYMKSVKNTITFSGMSPWKNAMSAYNQTSNQMIQHPNFELTPSSPSSVHLPCCS